MQSTVANRTTEKTNLASWFLDNRGLLGLLLLLIAFPFLLSLVEGQSFGDVLANESGNAKFMQGLLIEVFILAIYALSYDLILGVTGLLSFGHAMFFASGAYFTGIAFKNFGWGVGQTLLGLIVVGVVQALLFGVVLPRVKGITFALVTLGLASVFQIVRIPKPEIIKVSELRSPRLPESRSLRLSDSQTLKVSDSQSPKVLDSQGLGVAYSQNLD